MLAQKNHKLKIVISIIVCFVFSSLSLLAILNRQFIVDQITVWQFEPASGVVALVDRAGMGDYGKFLYLASEPTLESTQRFNSECQRTEIVTSILGCYRSGRIYLYNITDSELNGIRETTAAHETLHAAYVRMSDTEKIKINNLIEVEYQKLEHITEYQELMAFYAATEPGQRDNELHSIIGTEVSDISPDLERHYAKYFSDRQKVVELNDKYKAVFEALDKKADELTTKMTDLSVSIKARVDQYNSETIALNGDISAFNSKSATGGFNTESQFNVARNKLVSRINSLDTIKVAIETDIETYGKLLIEYNAIATKSEKLSNSIDSTFAPTPSV